MTQQPSVVCQHTQKHGYGLILGRRILVAKKNGCVREISRGAQHLMTGVIDLFSPSSYAHGHPTDRYAWLRDNDPVHWHEEPNGPGFWAGPRHGDAKTVARKAALFS